MCMICEENDGEMTNCQDCGRLICFDEKGSGDDVIAPAYVTYSGDLFCLQCGKKHEEAEEERDCEESAGLDFEL